MGYLVQGLTENIAHLSGCVISVRVINSDAYLEIVSDACSQVTGHHIFPADADEGVAEGEAVTDFILH